MNIYDKNGKVIPYIENIHGIKRYLSVFVERLGYFRITWKDFNHEMNWKKF